MILIMNNPKRKTTTFTSAYNSYSKQVKWISSKTTYNEDLNPLKEEYYDSKGNVTGFSEFMYNEKGLLAQITSGLDKQMVDKTMFVYNEQNDIIKETLAYADGVSKTIKMYSYAPNRLEIQIKDEKGALEEIYISETDTEGNLLKEIYKDGERKIRQINNYVYQHGLLQEEFVFDGNNQLLNKANHFYDVHGNSIETIWYNDKEKPVQKSTRDYDQTGNLIYENFDDFELRKFKYNEKNQKIYEEVVLVENNTVLANASYEYNENNDLIKEEIFAINDSFRIGFLNVNQMMSGKTINEYVHELL